MKKIVQLTIFILWGNIVVFAQTASDAGSGQHLDFATTMGHHQGSTALAYVHSYKFGKNKRFDAGLGLRLTNSYGNNNRYITAGPARLTRSFTAPFLIFFAGQETQNWDTLTVRRPLVNALNITANLSYAFTARISAGFNIDLIGYSFGRKSPGTLQSQGILKMDPAVRPSNFNLLLTGDHDKGTLNSEFFLKYQFNSNWGLRAIYQFLFTEYKTNSVEQIASDGTRIEKFRNKANNFGLGISYHF
ncbi:hypothetical protein [Dyadobacter tibetensis]|uniref:hypothetical protein n=1 Tax=Dyadobacter tibetensis TaxID=1211851 RepID=UPI000472001F|nr:hypothetical protein [Dyadobacter tibetensis]